jgi:hypothetical protein
MSREIVHICVLEKFIPPFIELVRNNFTLDKHLFLVSGKLRNFVIPSEEAVVFNTTILGRLRYLVSLYRAKKIILHGLYDSKFLYLLALQPWLLKKCYWMVWGDDLYQYFEPCKRLKKIFKEKVRAFVISRLGYIVTYIPGDYELACEHYKSDAKLIDCLLYQSNVFSSDVELGISLDDNLVIQLGNSAFPRNNHIEAMSRLACFKDEAIILYAPLSYGPKKTVESVTASGYQIFGDKFVPLLNFMVIDEYKKFLSRVNIAIFNNTRQQAMGNIIALAGLGKTVYVRRSTTTWQLFEEIGIKLLDAEHFSLSLLTPEEQTENIKRVQIFFSKERLLTQLEKLFSA